MALAEIDPGWARPLPTYFGRRGPWGALFARSGNNNNTARGSNGDLTRRERIITIIIVIIIII